MKKFKLTSVFLIVSLIAPSLLNAQVNEFDSNGKRHGVWRKYYQNNRIRYEGTFHHGKEVGTFKYYSAANSEFPTVVKKFNDTNSIAEVYFYSETGKLMSKGQMDGKMRIGKWIYYHEDGVHIMSEENYVNNKLNGPFKTFYITGKPTEIAYYKDGLRDSVYRKYSIKGHLFQHFTYKNGKLNGKAVYYNRKTGELTAKGQFKDDLRVGTWENYVDGELVSTEQPNKKKERPKTSIKKEVK
ncbi:toxin-antitoxin system YwqK family antitoxin [Flavobacteriaceae bacterium F08102]|nr:toxin-antitoxin system YwqK family antitoxin [Flavobacteriaceae bacterium F08102]